MRAANDRRNTVWAAAMAYSAREIDCNPKAVMPTLIRQLVEDGEIVLARTSWSGAVAERIPLDDVLDALEDDSQWHPRRLPWAQRLRLFATEEGQRRFADGEYGSPVGIAYPIPSPDRLELQAVTCVEAIGMSVAVVSYCVGSAVGYVIGNLGVPATLTDFSRGGIVGWAIGGIVGLGAAMSVWSLFSPKVDASELPPNVVPDQFNQGPELMEIDRFGDPRY
jgi:hypothetical protein